MAGNRVMNVIKCEKCGAECAEGTNFCRQCGAPIDPESVTPPSEQATALLEQPANVATHRFQARPTGPEPGRSPQPDYAADANRPPVNVAPPASPQNRRGIMIVAFVLGVITVIVVAAVLGLRGHSEKTGNLVYPGARTVVDMTGDGGRALHLETKDAFSDVEAWYQKQLKPDKTMRLTSSSVVMKNRTTTATLASEGDKTSILIKVAP